MHSAMHWKLVLDSLAWIIVPRRLWNQDHHNPLFVQHFGFWNQYSNFSKFQHGYVTAGSQHNKWSLGPKVPDWPPRAQWHGYIKKNNEILILWYKNNFISILDLSDPTPEIWTGAALANGPAGRQVHWQIICSFVIVIKLLKCCAIIIACILWWLYPSSISLVIYCVGYILLMILD